MGSNLKTKKTSATNVLVTGASGFVGLHLLNELVERGYKVTGVHNKPLSDEVNCRFGKAVNWVKVDIVSDNFDNIMKNIDVVFHLAAFSSVSEVDTERIKMQQVNVVGTKKVADASKQAGVKQFVFVSSIAACESSLALEINENNGFPVSTYGKTKLAAEGYLESIVTDKFNVTILRPTALFGEDHLGSVYELVKIIKKRRFFIIGNGENRKNFYYIGDFIEVLFAVLDNPKSFGQVFIAADKPYSLNNIVSIIVKEVRPQLLIPKVPMIVGLGLGWFCDVVSTITGIKLPLSKKRVHAMTADTVYSNSKLEEIMSVKVKYGLIDGLRRTIRWYQKTGLL